MNRFPSIAAGRRTLALLILTALTGAAFAQSSGGDYRLVRHVTAGGGGQSTGSGYSLRATVGQANAGVPAMLGGDFRLQGGYWAGSGAGGVLPDDTIFRNGFEATGGTP